MRKQLLAIWVVTVLVVTQVTLVASFTTASPCPPEYFEFEGYCYRASEDSNELENSWRDSRWNCMQAGGDLVSIHSSVEQQIVYSLLTGIADQYWTGLNLLDGALTWSDGSVVDYVNWAPGQPDDEDQTELCMYMDRFDSTENWNLKNCGMDVFIGSVCKIPVGADTPITSTPPPILDAYCPEGFFEVSDGVPNKCYRIVFHEDGIDIGVARNWYGARDFCRNQPGFKPDLVSITSVEEQAAITSQLLTISWGLWIGYYFGEDGIWFWTDQSTADYENWRDLPENVVGNCIEMFANAADAGKWASADCTHTRGYICQTFKNADDPILTPPITTPHSCQSGWIPYWNSCYMLSSTSTSWSLAQSNCESEGGNLVSIYGPEENSAVIYLSEGRVLWIGMSRNDASSPLTWSDGTAVVYTNFVDGGSSPPGSDNCIIFNNAYTWQDIDCDDEFYFLCKQSYGPVPTTPIYAGGEECPSAAWTEFGSACYIFPTEYLPAQAAEISCNTENAHLASVHSYVENVFIRENSNPNFDDNIYIGLYKDSGEGLEAFRWIDGTVVDFTYWAMGEPNEPQTEDCVIQYNHDPDDQFTLLWNNIDCSEARQYVCKYERSVPPPSSNNTRSQPSHYVIHNTTFTSSTGEDFSPQCTQAYSIQMNQNAQSMRSRLNSLIGSQLCVNDGVTSDQMSVIYVTCPFSTIGSEGATDPFYIIKTSPELSLSAVHACVTEISAYASVYSNWGEYVLAPEPNCPEVIFSGSEFHENRNKYLCLGSLNLKQENSYDIEVAFLNYGVSHIGRFYSEDGQPITNECIIRYSASFTARAATMAQQVNTLIMNGDLCDQQDITISNISPLFLTGAGTEGSTSQRYILNPSVGMTFSQIEACAQEVSIYLADHTSWGEEPILPPLEGCPTLLFNPEEFAETGQEWICNTNTPTSQKNKNDIQHIEVPNNSKDNIKFSKITVQNNKMKKLFMKMILGQM